MRINICLILLTIVLSVGCKKKEDFVPTGSILTTDTSFMDIVAGNGGRNLNLSKNGLRVVVWNNSNDTIFVYNTFDGSLQSQIVHAHHFASGEFQRVMLVDDGTKVISQQDNYEIKVWDAITGGFIRDLPTIFEWVP